MDRQFSQEQIVNMLDFIPINDKIISDEARKLAAFVTENEKNQDLMKIAEKGVSLSGASAIMKEAVLRYTREYCGENDVPSMAFSQKDIDQAAKLAFDDRILMEAKPKRSSMGG